MKEKTYKKSYKKNLQEIPDVQAGFRKCTGTRDQIANMHWIIEKNKRIPEKKIYFKFIDYAKAFVQSQQTVKFFKRWKYQTT